MVAQRKELAATQFNFVPTTLKEAQEYATIFASSGLCPEAYRGRPNDILIVWQIGHELGIGKAQSLRTFGCINGVPFAYGDGKFALVKRHPEFEDCKEWFEEKTQTAYCTIKRKGKEPITQKFSKEDAITANLWSKKGPWTQYPRRMLQHRARGFAVNDSFPDAFFGIPDEFEAKDIVTAKQNIVEVKQTSNKGMKGLEESLGISNDEAIIDGEFTLDQTDEKETILNKLNQIIIEQNISTPTRDAWCNQFNVSVVDDIPVENLKNIIKHYKEKN